MHCISVSGLCVRENLENAYIQEFTLSLLFTPAQHSWRFSAPDAFTTATNPLHHSGKGGAAGWSSRVEQAGGAAGWSSRVEQPGGAGGWSRRRQEVMY